MRKIAFIFVLFTTVAFSQKNIFENKNFDEFAKEHEILAIVPFIAHLELKKEVDRDDLKVLAKKEGQAVQNALETYFSKRKERKGIDVEFQNIRNRSEERRVWKDGGHGCGRQQQTQQGPKTAR